MKIRRSFERGHANHGWLDAYHTFSFADYYDPAHVHFEHLRVINQDRVAPGRGFPTHGHQDMEIVTWVLEGALEHKDNMGHGARMGPGEVQFMSAGRGVLHSEFNPSQEEALHLLQMWVLPAQNGGTPRYDQRRYPVEGRRGRLQLVVAPAGDPSPGAQEAIEIGQDARMLVGLFDAGERFEYSLEPGRSAWIHVARGRLSVAGEELGAGDGVGIEAAGPVVFEGLEDAEVVVWDLVKLARSVAAAGARR
jgi:quercetin 2,3-dioxygenase